MLTDVSKNRTVFIFRVKISSWTGLGPDKGTKSFETSIKIYQLTRRNIPASSLYLDSIFSHNVPLPRCIFGYHLLPQCSTPPLYFRLSPDGAFIHDQNSATYTFKFPPNFKISSQISLPPNRILSNMQYNAFFVLYFGRCNIFLQKSSTAPSSCLLKTLGTPPFSRRHSTISPPALIVKEPLHDTSIHESSFSSSHLPLTQ